MTSNLCQFLNNIIKLTRNNILLSSLDKPVPGSVLLIYAQVIGKLMAAGARAVALDIIFATPSSYETIDDRELARVL